MEMTVGLFLLLFTLAFACEFIDSSLGMGYGTILTPVLLILGFEPLVVIPAVLLSQALGGFTASIFHNRFENVSFTKDSRDTRIVLIISGFGLIATILASLIAIHLPKVAVKTYIGVLVLTMGIVVIMNRPFKFSWRKMIGIGVISAFNKGLSGGGFGPVVTGGQVLAGQDHKAAIGATTLAEVPICICGFLTYLIGRTVAEIDHPVLSMPFADFLQHMLSPKMFQWELFLALTAGAILVGPFGAFATRSLKTESMPRILGSLIIALGAWTLARTWL
ncbi:MAG: sulfite exporter TauE/SafE family protein [Verrucomicrobia bacterium]|nr:sulfite exporter TauE/SafE family protein [Verrucomicrobiota bacterium]